MLPKLRSVTDVDKKAKAPSMLESSIPLPYWFELAAILTGGLSGAMTAVQARYDIFGTMFIACVTGMGGGILRDVLLQDYGIYAFQNPSLLLACLVGAILVFYFGKLATYLDPIVDLLDNLSVALWAIIGVSKSLSAGLDVVPCVLLGTLTACGGGILRDVFMNKRTPVSFQAGYLYGTAAIIGCAAYALMYKFNFLMGLAPLICTVIILGIRYGSLIFGWQTKPPRDYSDAVTDAVTRPVKFIARKVHVPIGKTARERDNRFITKLRRNGRRLYRRLSGQWIKDKQQEEDNKDKEIEVEVYQPRQYVTIEEPHENGAPAMDTDAEHDVVHDAEHDAVQNAEHDVVHDAEHDVEHDVASIAGKTPGTENSQTSSATRGSSTVSDSTSADDSPARAENSPGNAITTDENHAEERILISRDELHRIIAEAEERASRN